MKMAAAGYGTTSSHKRQLFGSHPRNINIFMRVKWAPKDITFSFLCELPKICMENSKKPLHMNFQQQFSSNSKVISSGKKWAHFWAISFVALKNCNSKKYCSDSILHRVPNLIGNNGNIIQSITNKCCHLWSISSTMKKQKKPQQKCKTSADHALPRAAPILPYKIFGVLTSRVQWKIVHLFSIFLSFSVPQE